MTLLGVHEYKLHGIKGISDHTKLYPLQMKDPTWNKTTDAFKQEQIRHWEAYNSWIR